jgi:hypothetical protein
MQCRRGKGIRLHRNIAKHRASRPNVCECEGRRYAQPRFGRSVEGPPQSREKGGSSDILHLLCRQKSSYLGHRTWVHMLSHSHPEHRKYPYVGGSHTGMSQDHDPAEL